MQVPFVFCVLCHFVFVQVFGSKLVILLEASLMSDKYSCADPGVHNASQVDVENPGYSNADTILLFCFIKIIFIDDYINHF